MEEATARIRGITPPSRKISVAPLLGTGDPHFVQANRQIVISCPSAFLRASEDEIKALSRKLALLVLDDLHLLDDLYELSIARILSIAKPLRVRIVGLSSSLNDPSDLATWLGVDEASTFAFYPPDRSNPVAVSTRLFNIPHSSALLKSMVKPTYDALKSSTGGAIIFAPSRAACRSIAADLVTQSGTEMDLNGFLGAPQDDVEPMLYRLRDQVLFEPILHGIGYIVPGMKPHDLALILELFASNILRALIVPREGCWTLPVRAETVILMGAQYVRITDTHREYHRDRGDRQVLNYSRQELVQMQGFAIPSAAPQATAGRMFIMCQAEQSVSILRVLKDGLPLESSLPALLSRKASSEASSALWRMMKQRPPPPKPQINRPMVPDLRKKELMDLLGWTYFAHRIKSNPTFYDLHPDTIADGVSRLVDKWFEADEYATPPDTSEEVRSKPKRGPAGSLASMEQNGVVEMNGTGVNQGENAVGGGVGMQVSGESAGDVKIGIKDGETLDDD